MHKLVKLITVSLLLFSSQAFSNAVWCYGNVERVYVEHSGGLIIFSTWRNEYTQLCSVNSVWKGITQEVCKSWLSMAMTAKVSQVPVITHYASSSCESMPTYSNALAPIYFMLNK
ncbi:hypothetical protein GMA8713_05025 [Grimontia marina]|uniref:Uncharacterized protein n=1 Tax=Grimontia marina TaxID=646534 RepID=A0A128FL34_9GAMM|nr:hypothetical protein GMA8713_05025 [Grimontia marina]